ncbi:hypothetical protein [Bradyrhizobium sp. WSM1743]|uniref:hypothetical protein n=1 Tax=Bradyrhizobium sp. WSM1743 TaxID=318996 RepID=UPI001FD8F027|nr:hypothetical protein [Bradyrhizobium sp. WSM1743]
MQKPLRHAQLYGYPIERDGDLFHPGGVQPSCGPAMAKRMVEAGLLVKIGSRYELTPEALRQLR